MARIKIKTRENLKERRTKLKLLEFLSSCNVYATTLLEAHDGYIVTTANDHEVDKILDPQATNKLSDSGFTPVPPQELSQEGP